MMISPDSASMGAVGADPPRQHGGMEAVLGGLVGVVAGAAVAVDRVDRPADQVPQVARIEAAGRGREDLLQRRELRRPFRRVRIRDHRGVLARDLPGRERRQRGRHGLGAAARDGPRRGPRRRSCGTAWRSRPPRWRARRSATRATGHIPRPGTATRPRADRARAGRGPSPPTGTRRYEPPQPCDRHYAEGETLKPTKTPKNKGNFGSLGAETTARCEVAEAGELAARADREGDDRERRAVAGRGREHRRVGAHHVLDVVEALPADRRRSCADRRPCGTCP